MSIQLLCGAPVICGWARESRPCRILFLLVLGLFAVFTSPAPASTQTVRGHVVEAESGLPMEGVDVVLLDTAGAVVKAAVTDRSGEFILAAPDAGRYRVRGQRLGYAAVESDGLMLGPTEVVEVEMRLGIRPVELEGLNVVERRKREGIVERDMRHFRERLEHYPEYVGIRIFTRDALERVHGWSLEDVMTLRPGRRCKPKLYWNGMRKKPFEVDRRTPIESLEAVEFWSGFGAPRSFFSDEDGCGVILVWTRR